VGFLVRKINWRKTGGFCCWWVSKALMFDNVIQGDKFFQLKKKSRGQKLGGKNWHWNGRH